MVLLQLKDPLELFPKRREFIHRFGFLSRCDMTLAVDRDLKPHSFLPLHNILLGLEFLKGLLTLMILALVLDIDQSSLLVSSYCKW